jgi:hypothetical protein
MSPALLLKPFYPNPFLKAATYLTIAAKTFLITAFFRSEYARKQFVNIHPAVY